MADQLNRFADAVDRRVESGEDTMEAAFREARSLIASSRRIHFDGNGYSDEWKAEAARRGLDTETSVPLMYDAYLSEESIRMFGATGVFTPVELQARNEVKWEIYTKKVQIEARVLGDITLSQIIPAATAYMNRLLDNATKLRALFSADTALRLGAGDISTIETLSAYLDAAGRLVRELVEARKVANRIGSEREKAIAYHDTVVPLMDEIRRHIDKLELMVDDEIWPLPKYREMLFIR